MKPTSTFEPTTQFIVKTSSAPNKASWKWRHRRRNVAVLEIDPGARIRMISERARGVRAIKYFAGGLYAGQGGDKTQYARHFYAAQALAERLNREARIACDAAPVGASCG